jgi:hypothetical protein
VRQPTGDAGRQLPKMLGGRVVHPKVDYGTGAPAIGELGAFLTCFFIGQILMQIVINASLYGNTGEGNLASTVIGAAVFTVAIAFVLSQSISCLKNTVLLIAILLAVLSLVMVWKSAQSAAWLGIGFAVYNLGISGWLASILSRQASME